MESLDHLTFEQALLELEEIVRKLEEGRLSLDDSVGAYERGALLKKLCEQKLSSAKLKLDQIVTSQNGTLSLQPLDLE